MITTPLVEKTPIPHIASHPLLKVATSYSYGNKIAILNNQEQENSRGHFIRLDIRQSFQGCRDPILVTLFTCMDMFCGVPRAWSSSVVVPMCKEGEQNNFAS